MIVIEAVIVAVHVNGNATVIVIDAVDDLCSSSGAPDLGAMFAGPGLARCSPDLAFGAMFAARR